MENVLISASLLGFACKYCGGSNKLSEQQLAALGERFRLIPVCPETAGGLPTPRDPSERLGDRVVSNQGRDVTEQYRKGAETALWLARRYGCTWAILKERSPSCGAGAVYDGSFTHTQVPGDGITARLLAANGIHVIGESQLDQLPED